MSISYRSGINMDVNLWCLKLNFNCFVGIYLDGLQKKKFLTCLCLCSAVSLLVISVLSASSLVLPISLFIPFSSLLFPSSLLFHFTPASRAFVMLFTGDLVSFQCIHVNFWLCQMGTYCSKSHWNGFLKREYTDKYMSWSMQYNIIPL